MRWSERLIETLENGGRAALQAYLVRQRWFGAKGRKARSVRLLDHALIADRPYPTVLAVAGIDFDRGPSEAYLLLLAIRPGRPRPEKGPAFTILPERGEASPLLTLPSSDHQEMEVWDGTADPPACLALLEGIRAERAWRGMAGVFTCLRTSALEPLSTFPFRDVQRLGTEQSNTSIVYDWRAILKLIRRMAPGLNPDYEVLEFLTTRTEYAHVPRLLGHIRYEGPLDAREGHQGERQHRLSIAAVLQTFVPNEGDGWGYLLQHLRALLAASATRSLSLDTQEITLFLSTASGHILGLLRRLGEITAELHLALASDASHPSFCPEPITAADIAAWEAAMRTQAQAVLRTLKEAPELTREMAGINGDESTALIAAYLHKLKDLSLLLRAPVMKIRIHGDYHLGQILKTEDGFTILDFEGEPARPIEERRAKSVALKDVAGMLRSFDYAAQVALREGGSSEANHLGRTMMARWTELAGASFLSGYRETALAGNAPFLPDSATAIERLLQIFQLDKAVYELGYEFNNRPDWLRIPLEGLRRLASYE